MAANSFVQVPPNSTGPRIDVAQVTDPIANLTENRQIAALGDPVIHDALMDVSTSGEAQVTSNELGFLLKQLLAQARLTNMYLALIAGTTLVDQTAGESPDVLFN